MLSICNKGYYLPENSEYNNFEEVKKFDENKYIESIETSCNNKESYAPKNESLITEEYWKQRTNKRKSLKNNDKGFFRKLIQKVTETTSTLASSIAVTSTIAIATVVVLTSVLINSPNIQLIDLVSGYDYVTYNLYIDEMDESLDYYSIISNNFEIYKFELVIFPKFG